MITRCTSARFVWFVLPLFLLQYQASSAFFISHSPKTTATTQPTRILMANPTPNKDPPSTTTTTTTTITSSSRRQHLSSFSAAASFFTAAALFFPPHIPAAQARTEPLGIVDQLLAECPPNGKSCASSQDDRPAVFQEPWLYDDSSMEKAMKKLRTYVEGMPGVEVITAERRYLYVIFSEGGGAVVDDTEFYFTPSDAIIQFRSARRGGNDRGANLKRMEKIRIALGFEKIPVLRNRRRALFFMESPLDQFGPTYGQDAPGPEELEQAYKDQDPLSPEWGPPSLYPRRDRGK